MSNLELRIEEEANLGLTISDSSDMSFNAVDFVGVPFAPTVEVEDIEGGHRVSITSMGAEGKKTDEFDVMDGADGATWLNGNILIGELAEGTVLTADDAYAAPPKGVEVYGVSTQASYTGKNLFNINGVSFGTNASNVTKTSTGVTVTANLASGWSYGAAIIEVSNVSSITLSAVPSKSTPRIGLEGYYSDNTIAVTKSALADSVTVTLPDGVVKVRCIFYSRQTASGAVGDTCTYNNIQLELGSTATSYEPYTGGKAAPRPDWPQEIKSVDDLTLVFAGKNLFGGTALRDAILAINPNSVTGSDANGSYVTNPTNATMNGATVLAGPFKSNTVYTIVLAARSSTTSAHAPNLQVKYTDGTYAYLPSITDAYSVGVFSTRDNKTVEKIIGTWSTGTDYYYYDSCGIFEGVLTADQFEPYVGQSVEIPLGNHIARSLPDGTRDELTLSYVGPSTEHEGWGVFSAELVQRVGEVPDLSTLAWEHVDASPSIYYAPVSDMSSGTTFREMVVMCGAYAPAATPSNAAGLDANTGVDKAICKQNNNNRFFIKDTDFIISTAEAFTASLIGINAIYPLATPITTDLGTVELPILPNPLTAWADGGSAQPTLAMEYERSLSIVIPRIEDAIADMATS